jgi:hypothetical protein
VNRRLQVARAAVRGTGFADVSFGSGTASAPANNDDKLAAGLANVPRGRTMPVLPGVNMLKLAEKELETLLEVILPSDRDIFCKYMQSRPLGLGLCTAVSSLFFSLTYSVIWDSRVIHYPCLFWCSSFHLSALFCHHITSHTDHCTRDPALARLRCYQSRSTG